VHGAVTANGAEAIHFGKVKVPDKVPGVAGILRFEDSEIDTGGVKDGLNLQQDSRPASPATMRIDGQAEPFRGPGVYHLAFR
jgi:hypothetical protein